MTTPPEPGPIPGRRARLEELLRMQMRREARRLRYDLLAMARRAAREEPAVACYLEAAARALRRLEWQPLRSRRP